MAGPGAEGPRPANMQFRETVQGGTSLWAALPYILAYWFTAIALILMNASFLHKVHFPATLTAYHQFCCTVLVYIMWVAAPRCFGTDCHRLSAGTVASRVFPIALLFALCLGVGNRAYLFLSVAFIQMIKAGHPVLTYVFSCCFGVEAFRQNKLQAVMVVTFGVVLSVTGELHFNMKGFLIQIFGSACECVRVVLIGMLLSKDGLKLDPMTSLTYIAPLAFLVLLPMALATEILDNPSDWLAQLRAEVGIVFMVANGLMAFALNIVTMSLISRTDPVVYVVVGVLKDILTVIISGIIFATPVTKMQVGGYLLALAGVQLYNMVQKDPSDFEKGLYMGLWAKVRDDLPCIGQESASSCKALLPPECPPMAAYSSVGEAARAPAPPATAKAAPPKEVAKDVEAGDEAASSASTTDPAESPAAADGKSDRSGEEDPQEDEARDLEAQGAEKAASGGAAGPEANQAAA